MKNSSYALYFGITSHFDIFLSIPKVFLYRGLTENGYQLIQVLKLEIEQLTNYYINEHRREIQQSVSSICSNAVTCKVLALAELHNLDTRRVTEKAKDEYNRIWYSRLNSNQDLSAYNYSDYGRKPKGFDTNITNFLTEQI